MAENVKNLENKDFDGITSINKGSIAIKLE